MPDISKYQGWTPSSLCQLCTGRLGQTKVSAANHFRTKHNVGYTISSLLARDMFIGQTSNQEVWEILVEMEGKQATIDKKQFAIKCKDGVIRAHQDTIKKLEKEVKRKLGKDKETMTYTVLHDNKAKVEPRDDLEIEINISNTEYEEFKVADTENMKKQLASKIELKSKVNELFKSLEEKNKVVALSEKKIIALDKEVKTLQDALKHKRKFINRTLNKFTTPEMINSNENAVMKKELKDLNKKNAKLRQLLTDKDLQIDGLQRKLRNVKMEEELGGLVSVVKKQRKKIDKQAGLLELGLEEANEFETKRYRQKKLVEYFKNELITERYETDKKDSEIDKLKSDIDDLNKEVITLRKESENDKLEKCIHGLKFQLKDLEILLDAKHMTIKNLEILIGKVTFEREALSNKLLKTNLVRMQDEHNFNVEKEAYEVSLKKIESHLEPMQREFEVFKVEKAALVKLLESSNLEIQYFKTLNTKLIGEKEILLRRNLKSQEKLKQLQRKPSQEAGLGSLDEEKINLSRQLEKLKKDFREEIVLNERLARDNLSFLKQLEEVKQVLEGNVQKRFRTKIRQLESDNLVILKEFKQIQNAFDNKENLLKTSERKIIVVEDKVCSLRVENTGLHEAVRTDEVVIQQLRCQIVMLFEKNERLEDEVNDIQIHLDQKLNQYKEDNLNLINQLEETSNVLREENIGLSKEISRVQNILLDKDKILKTKADKVIQVGENQDLPSGLGEDLIKLQTLVKKITEMSTKAAVINLEYKLKTKKLEEFKTMFANDLDFAQNSFSQSYQCQLEVSSMKTRLDGLKSELEGQQNYCKSMKALEQEKRKLEEEKTVFINDIELLKQNLKLVENKNACLKGKYDKLKVSVKDKIRKLYEQTEAKSDTDDDAKVTVAKNDDLENNNNNNLGHTLLIENVKDSDDDPARRGPIILARPAGERNSPTKRTQEGKICFSLNKKSKS